KEIDKSEPRQLPRSLVEIFPAALRRGNLTPAPIGLRPFIGFNQAAPYPPCRERRKHSDNVHPAPRGSAEGADEKPNAGGEEKSDAQSALHQSRALTAVFGGPHLCHHRGTRAPFRAKREDNDETQGDR